MKFFFFVFFAIPLFVFSDWNDLFSENEDPTVFHHVNVISGQLNLSIQDTVLQGAHPFPLIRTYTSSGALEKKGISDLVLKAVRRNWLIQGGWNFLPHANLLIFKSPSTFRKNTFRLPEPNGATITYVFSHKEFIKGETFYYYFKPEKRLGAHSGVLSSRHDPQNNLLRARVNKRDRDEFEVTVFLANGGVRQYRRLGEISDYFKGTSYYKLISEQLPSKRWVEYKYDKKDKLWRIEIKNPARTKMHAWIQLDVIRRKPPFEFRATTSDNRSFLYKATEADRREYISEVTSNCKRKENFYYSQGHSQMGSRVSEICFENNLEVRVHYYNSDADPRERDAKFYKQNRSIDKVESLEAPVGESNQMKRIAKFFYNLGFTDVQDVDGALIRYHYPDGQITRIEHFHKDGGDRHSVLDFVWEKERMIAKVFSDGQGRPIFSKTFRYDEKGNVEEEVLWGNLTGKVCQERFLLNSDGSLSYAECRRKSYTYEPITNFLIHEEEERGLSYDYGYKPGTDLLIFKATKKNDQILKREFFVYNEDNFLVEEIIDDGITNNIDDIKEVNQRYIKRYELDWNFGTRRSLTELCLDPSSGLEVLLKKHEYSYDANNLLSEEKIYDANGEYKYSLLTGHDDRGRVNFKTTPMGETETYVYDNKDHLWIERKVGMPEKRYNYDAVGRVLSCLEVDDKNQMKTTYYTYDYKGNVLSQTDTLGNVTRQIYDTFGKCIKTELPDVQDPEGNVYTPTIYFTYDNLGNLASHTNPKGETTYTEYNVFGKPTRIIRPDGTTLMHFYYKDGTLAKTVQSDQTEILYEYDPFLRMSFKAVRDSSGALLSEEHWNYDTFQLKWHKDENELVTTFSYDGSGKKVAEFSGKRAIFYAYDSLGFLETTTYGDTEKVEIHDLEGCVIEKMEKKGSQIENHTKFKYEKGRLKETYRMTSLGEVVDRFSYDAEGRLCEHINPLGEKTQFLYHIIKNDLGQFVFCKTTINELGYKTVEIEDVSSRILSREKQDSQGDTFFKEEFFYDLAGNKVKRVSTVYLKDIPIKKVEYSCTFDEMGRVLKEIEAGKKITSYSYKNGRVESKTLPSGVVLTYKYDGLGRISSLRSSDNTVDYRYKYRRGNTYVEVEDLLTSQKILRFYNAFGELASERFPNFKLFWNYDEMGRCDRFTLPDKSCISYEYLEGHLQSVTRRDRNNFPLYEHTYLKIDVNNHVTEEKLIYDLGIIRTSHDFLERPYLQTSKWHTNRVFYDSLGRVDLIQNSLFPEKKISYDPLNQITQEGDKNFVFDSIGNLSKYETNDCNEVLSTDNSTLVYDLDGNLKERNFADQTIFYSYDALARLTSITYPGKKKILYFYDPFSRISSKHTYEFREGDFQKTEEIFLLYDKDKEIGSLNEQGQILQLKVLGLGIGAEIGAAVAIELNQTVYAPLHDFRGNCIALLSPSGDLVELYEIDAFGKELTSPPLVKNPWRFSSKRQEEGLVFFGLRFYDLALGRWLTPDPAGFVDGSNLYVYVGNSPFNRLDLFGLQGLDQNPIPIVEVRVMDVTANLDKRTLIPAIAIVEGVRVDWYVSCGHWHQLQFSAAEIQEGKIDILSHFSELIPSNGGQVGLLSLLNGIQTSLSDFKGMCQSVVDKIPEGTLFFGMHDSCLSEISYSPRNSLDKVCLDLSTASLERNNIATPAIRLNTQMMGAIAETLHKVNPNSIWVGAFHSKGGVVGRRALERVTDDQKQIFKSQFYGLTIGAAQLMPNSYGLEVYNIYSNKDYVTRMFAKEQNDGFRYNVEFVKCISPFSERTAYFADHAFMGLTYQTVLEDRLVNLRKIRGFYEGSKR